MRVAILAMTLIFLQQQFDQGDLNRAIALLMSKPPGAHWSVAEELNARAGAGGTPQCEPKLVSSFAGTLQVTCAAGPKGPYLFSIDLALPLRLRRTEAAFAGLRLFWIVRDYTPARIQREIAAHVPEVEAVSGLEEVAAKLLRG